MSKPGKRAGNYWITAVITLAWWFILGGMVLWVDPEVVADYPLPGSYGLFFLFLFLGIWFLASLILSNSRRGLLVAIWFVLIGYLQIWRLANLVNIGLLTGALIALEIYKNGGKLKKG